MNTQAWKPYTDRSADELQSEIDHIEETTPHDELPERYDALIWLRDRALKAEDAQ